MPLTAGARLGPYEVIALLGAGGVGEVYKARDARLDRTVAASGSSLPPRAAAGRSIFSPSPQMALAPPSS